MDAEEIIMNFQPMIIARTPELRDPVIEYVKNTAMINEQSLDFIKKLTKTEDKINKEDKTLLSNSYRKILFHHLQGIKKIIQNNHDITDEFDLQARFAHFYGHAGDYAYYLFKQRQLIPFLKKAYRLSRSAHRIAIRAASLGVTIPEKYEFGFDVDEFYDIVTANAIAALKGQELPYSVELTPEQQVQYDEEIERLKFKPLYPREEYMLKMFNYSYSMLKDAANYAYQLSRLDPKNQTRWLKLAIANYELFFIDFDSGSLRLSNASEADHGSYLQRIRNLLQKLYRNSNPGVIDAHRFKLFDAYRNLFYALENDKKKQAQIAYKSVPVMQHLSRNEDRFSTNKKNRLYYDGAIIFDILTRGLHVDTKEALEVKLFRDAKSFYEHRAFELAKQSYESGNTNSLELLAEKAKKTADYDDPERAKDAYKYLSKLAEISNPFENLVNAAKMAEKVYKFTNDVVWLKQSINAYSGALSYKSQVSPRAFNFADSNKNRLNKLLDDILKNRR